MHHPNSLGAAGKPPLLRFSCPACAAGLSVPVEMAGVTGPCPACGSPVQAPLPKAPEPAMEQLAPVVASTPSGVGQASVPPLRYRDEPEEEGLAAFLAAAMASQVMPPSPSPSVAQAAVPLASGPLPRAAVPVPAFIPPATAALPSALPIPPASLSTAPLAYAQAPLAQATAPAFPTSFPAGQEYAPQAFPTAPQPSPVAVKPLVAAESPGTSVDPFWGVTPPPPTSTIVPPTTTAHEPNPSATATAPLVGTETVKASKLPPPRKVTKPVDLKEEAAPSRSRREPAPAVSKREWLSYAAMALGMAAILSGVVWGLGKLRQVALETGPGSRGDVQTADEALATETDVLVEQKRESKIETKSLLAAQQVVYRFLQAKNWPEAREWLDQPPSADDEAAKAWSIDAFASPSSTEVALVHSKRVPDSSRYVSTWTVGSGQEPPWVFIVEDTPSGPRLSWDAVAQQMSGRLAHFEKQPGGPGGVFFVRLAVAPDKLATPGPLEVQTSSVFSGPDACSFPALIQDANLAQDMRDSFARQSPREARVWLKWGTTADGIAKPIIERLEQGNWGLQAMAARP